MEKTRKVVIIVEAQLPYEIGTVEFRNYVDGAIRSMCYSRRPPGGYDELDPGDRLFNVDQYIKKVCYISVNWLRGYLWKRWPEERWPV